MRALVLISICLAILWQPYHLSAGMLLQDDYGPNVQSFLDFLQQEEQELEFQIHHDEISRHDYTRAKNRFAIMRETVLGIVRKNGQDIVPELHIVTAQEIDQLTDKGASVLRGIRAGAIIEDTWRYLGRVTRGETFYIFERIAKK